MFLFIFSQEVHSLPNKNQRYVNYLSFFLLTAAVYTTTLYTDRAGRPTAVVELCKRGQSFCDTCLIDIVSSFIRFNYLWF